MLQTVIQRLVTDIDSCALWIDTSGDFSAERAAQLVRHFADAVKSIGETILCKESKRRDSLDIRERV